MAAPRCVRPSFRYPGAVARTPPRSRGWGKVNFSDFPQLQRYRERCDLVQRTLGMKAPGASRVSSRRVPRTLQTLKDDGNEIE